MMNVLSKFKDESVLLYIDLGDSDIDQYNLHDLVLKKQVIVDGVLKMHQTIKEHQFQSTADEIRFFKEIKPIYIENFVMVSWLIKWQTISFLGPKEKSKYLLKTKKKFVKFINKHKSFYDYLKLNQTYNDTLYFTRNTELTSIHKLQQINWFSGCVSTHGFIKAKLSAYERILKMISYQLEMINNLKQFQNKIESSSLVWTNAKIDLVELIYALFYAKAINNGNTSIKQITQAFDAIFKTELNHQIHRDFMDIKRRKIETTKFLVKLQNAVKERVDEQFS